MGETSGPLLNAAQQQAITINSGPVLVVAGAGTGKTRVITERIIRLIQDGAAPENILALTFTEKAAGEMRDRVGEASLRAALDTTIATYNSFGNDLLTRYGSEWGLGELRLLGDIGQLVFLREHFDEFGLEYFAPISNPDGQLDTLRSYVSQLKQQLVQPDVYLQYAGSLPVADPADALEAQKHRELARFYTTYLRLCRQHQAIDYDDQIFLAIDLLKSRPNILRTLRDQYRYILVDEFQDTNPMQSALVDLLAGTEQNLMVVGDDDQSIYGWRGATLANILDFKKRYPNARDITLIENYRSTQSILDAAYQLIQHNNPERLEVINKLDKRLHAQTSDGPPPIVRHFYTLEAELTWITDDIAERLQHGQDPGQIAILARTNPIVERAHQTLELHDIPHIMAGIRNDLYAQPAVRQLIEALKAVSDPLDDLALFHTLSGPLFELSQAELSALTAQARREHVCLASTIEQSDNELFTTALQSIAKWREQSKELNVGNLAFMLLDESGWKQRLYDQALRAGEAYVQVQALKKFFDTLKEFEHTAGVASVQSYLVNLPLLQAGGSDFEDASLDISDSLVNILSIHRSKGLEWDTVYVIDCTEGSFPARSHGASLSVPQELRVVKSAADERMAEERRLMYVAATRARHELILTYSDRHGSGTHRKPSRFLGEMFDTPATDTFDGEDQTSLELFAPRELPSTIPLPEKMLQDGIYVLTASQIDCWLKCPLDFYYKYVLGMPEPESPVAAYGTAIHSAIERIFEGRRTNTTPSLDELLTQVQNALPQAGYQSIGIRERAHAQALTSVRVIYDRFTKDELPVAVEQSFGVLIPNIPLKIIGRMDAVYQHGKGTEIRDFKTSSSVTTAEKAKDRATSSQQLTIYALAWQIMHGELPALLTLDFVETGQVGSIRKTQKSLDTLQAKLTTLIRALQAGEYPPGKDHSYCVHP
ncbi:MAG TPA: ATP-dependent DNA helicase [Verrucomicrobiae bacterium]|nr:ATP-dependent DNA helicase [Verrucomicrobiae bacterium]